MSAVALPAAIEALMSGASPTAAATDQASDFSQVLSSLATVPEALDKGSSPDANRAAASLLAALQVPKEPAQASLAKAPSAVMGQALERSEAPDAKAGPEETRNRAAAAPVLTAVLENLAQAEAVPAGPREPATSVKSAKADEEDDEPAGSKPPRDDHGLVSAGWTIQQALVAVAAIAGPAAAARTSGDPVQSSKPAGREAPAALVHPPKAGQPAETARTLAEALSPSGAASIVAAGISKLAATASKSAIEPQAGEVGPKTSATVTPELAIPLDPQVLTTALGHARLSGLAPLAIATSNSSLHQSSDLDLHQLDALVRDIAAVSGASGRAEFRLTASQLGQIDVRLHTSDAGVAVTIRTHDDQSHTTVTQAQQQLGDDMRANGLKVAATNVMLGGDMDRQRHDRPNAPVLPIEVATAEADQPQSSSNEQRPEGRYA